ncbi:MAG: MoaD/ThiS family protein [Sinobacterium sp.]|nr:MoaD/ThiS family protein [Sinobacterium sp.]
MNILFFAKLREDVGLASCSVSFSELGLEGAQSVQSVINALLLHSGIDALSGANLSALSASSGEAKSAYVLASVDQSLVDNFDKPCVCCESELAFFPPVTGG